MMPSHHSANVAFPATVPLPIVPDVPNAPVALTRQRQLGVPEYVSVYAAPTASAGKGYTVVAPAVAVADTLLAPSLSAIGPHVMAPPVRETERTPVAGCASLAASRGAPASSPTKPTPTLASPLGRRTRLTDTTCCATSVAAV